MEDASNYLKDYESFWPFYLREHSKPLTRTFHYIGTTCAVALLAWISLFGSWLSVWLVLLAGYGPAWYSHYFIEKNRPATFKAPLWSLFSDFRMYFYFLTGRIDGELRKYKIE